MSTLNWRRDPGYEQRKMQHELRQENRRLAELKSRMDALLRNAMKPPWRLCSMNSGCQYLEGSRNSTVVQPALKRRKLSAQRCSIKPMMRSTSA